MALADCKAGVLAFIALLIPSALAALFLNGLDKAFAKEALLERESFLKNF